MNVHIIPKETCFWEYLFPIYSHCFCENPAFPTVLPLSHRFSREIRDEIHKITLQNNKNSHLREFDIVLVETKGNVIIHFDRILCLKC